MAQSNATQTFTCALTGLSPIDDPVVTPSGYVCSRRPLLTKLSENGGVDPFDAAGARRLDESALVALAAGDALAAGAAPPRPPTAASLPALLGLLQGEFDAVLLELYDTRRALEEARRELSSALYQNDAAVRVVARVVAERDAARGRLTDVVAEGPAPMAVEEEEAGATPAADPPKRGRAAEDAGAAPAKKPKVVPAEEADAVDDAAPAAAPAEDRTKIPAAELAAMCAAWATLSQGRRTKIKRTPAETAANEAALGRLGAADAPGRKANLGAASAKAGVLCLGETLTLGDAEYVVAGGHHKTAVVYDVKAGRVAATLAGAEGRVTCVHGRACEEEGALLVAAGGADGVARLYAVPLGGAAAAAEEPTLLGSAQLAGEGAAPVAVTVHPASTHAAALVLVASSAGSVGLYRWREGDAGLTLLTLLDSAEAGTRFTAGRLHPDGLIYVAGTDDGRLVIWDLKTQAVAGTLEGHDGRPVDSIAISENGYHVASATSAAPDAPVHLWDLRKLKLGAIIATGAVGAVAALAFDPTATYLAYAGEAGARVCVAKAWDRVVASVDWPQGRGKEREGGAAGGVAWGGRFAAPAAEGAEAEKGEGGVWLAAGCDGQRPVRFWGIE